MCHERWGHMNNNYTQMLINLDFLPSMIFEKNNDCGVCVESKFIKLFFQTINKQ